MYSPKRKRNTVTTTTKKPSLKKKKLSHSPPPTPIPSLPDDMLLSIFARVSRVYYPILSLVSKSFRSLIASPELYETRSLLGRTESCLYLCLQERNPDSNPLWFTHCLKPDRTLTKGTRKTKKTKKSRGNILIPIPVPNPPLAHWSGHASVGSDIYFFGGYIENENVPSSRVLVLDCRSHTLREAPSMKREMLHTFATVIDGKIYVAGGNQDEDTDSLYPIEIFDSKTQIWDHMPIPYWGQNWGGLSISACVEGKFCMVFGRMAMAYDLEECRLDFVDCQMARSWCWSCNCTIDNVLFRYGGAIRWYDTKQSLWKNVKGLKGLLPKFGKNVYVKLVDYGGKMAAFWASLVSPRKGKYKTIWCAVIALERPNSEEIWGKVEWYEAVLTVPVSYEFEHALAVIV
ncbi:PREDICTED: F-box/kelch-repeat protein At4g39570-like [Camelina sativa]|uniref:F-box/kelch-repeat protein At4g39570-like n=1 Tax=Camelina sativa TaxID=90675 RepID=A0ABM0UUE0_CAMSA|nr:PREDICTED: F-box/kelch-repeat protein At4g39570-like [Camelina sativa]